MPLPTAYGTIPLGGALPEAYVPDQAIPLLGGALESGYGEVSYAVNMTAAASGSNGITVADDDDIDFGTASFGAHWEGGRDSWRPASAEEIYTKHQDASNYVSLICNTDGTVRLLAVVAGVTILDETSSAAVATTYNGKNLKLTFSCSRETASAAGSFQPYIDAAVLGAAQSITAASPTSISNSGALYIAGTDSKRFASNTISFVMLNFAPTASEVLDLCTNGIPASWKWGSQTALSLETNFETGSLVGSGLLSGAGGTYAINSTSPISGAYDGKFIYSSGSSSIYITTTSIPVSTTKTYRLSFDVKGSKSGLTIGRVQARTNTTGAASGASQNLTGSASITTTTSRVSFTFIPSIAIQSFRLDTLSGFTAGDTFQIDNIQIVQIGATMALLPDTIPTSSATTWSDTSGNTGGGTLPAAGATKVTIRR